MPLFVGKPAARESIATPGYELPYINCLTEPDAYDPSTDQPTTNKNQKFQLCDRFGNPYRRRYSERRRKQSLFNGQVTWMETRCVHVRNRHDGHKKYPGDRLEKIEDLLRRRRRITRSQKRRGYDPHNDPSLALENIWQGVYDDADYDPLYGNDVDFAWNDKFFQDEEDDKLLDDADLGDPWDNLDI